MNIVESGLDRLQHHCLDQILRWRMNGATVFAADVVCGTGRHAVLMSRIGAHVLAIDRADRVPLIDLERAIVNHGRRMPPAIVYRNGVLRLQYLRADLRAFAALVPGPRYDVIYAQTAGDVLHADEQLAVLRQFRQRMRLNGLLFISVAGHEGGSDTPPQLLPAGAAAHAAPAGLVWSYSEQDLRAVLEQAGLEPLLVFTAPDGAVQAIAQNS
jgi:SAM-dependent methyltransferase